MFNPNNLHDLQNSVEKQIIDRKSARISAKDFAIPVVAMANADGGYIVIGIEDDGTISGIDAYEKNINELVRVPFDYCSPSVMVENTTMEVRDVTGRINHILVMHVFPATQVIANQADDVFVRVGDKSKKLNFEQRLQLVYAKGVKYFEKQPVVEASISDLDLAFVSEYINKIGYVKGDAEFYLRHNNEFISNVDGKDVISSAAILLFGIEPQRFFPRARVRFVKYEGNIAEVGDRMNVVKDVKFSGRILEQVQGAIAFIKTQIREYTRLGNGAVFTTVPELPEFCWTELLVNAIAHRDYSVKGTDIQIKMFDDHFVVESPGVLPGIVTINNIREFHFSRNPQIVEFLNEYDFVKEFGEGVDRIYRDMAAAGLPEPVYKQRDFMLYAELRNKNWTNTLGMKKDTPHDTPHEKNEVQKLLDYCRIPRRRQEIMDYMRLTDRMHFYRHYLSPLLESGRIAMTIPDKPKSKLQKYVAVDEH